MIVEKIKMWFMKQKWFQKLFMTDGGDTDILFFEEEETTKKKYIGRDKAIEIADKECNLRKNIYRDARMRGERCGIVEITDYYATLVIYEKKYAWYVKIMDGKYGYKQDGEYYTGKLDDKSNIRCLIMADTGEYVFIDPTFNTKKIRMVTDDEYLRFINTMNYK